MQTLIPLKYRSTKPALILLHLCVATYLAAQPFDLRFDRLPNEPKAGIQHISQSQDGFLWLRTPSTSFRFDGNEFLAFPGPTIDLDTPSISLIWLDKTGGRWSGDTSLQYSSSDGNELCAFSLPPAVGLCQALFLHPAVTGDSILWVLTDEALLCFNLKQQQFTRIFRPRADDVQSLYGAPFRCAFISSEGILWLGGENGFCKYDWRNQEFRLYSLDTPADGKSGVVNFVLGVAGDPSKCWVTTSDLGLLQYDLYEHRILPEKIKGELTRLTNCDTYGLAYDKLGRLWVGNTSDSIFICDVQKNKILHRIPLHGDIIHFTDTDFKRGHFCYLLHEDNRMAMVRIVPETLQMDTFWIPYWQDQQSPITSWLHDREGTAWLLHGNQFFECFNPSPFRLEQKNIADFRGMEASDFSFKSFRADVDRKVQWLATAHALVKIHWEQETVTVYQNTSKGSDIKHKRIEVDPLGRVWVQCVPENVLYKFDPARETFARYDGQDGLPENLVIGIEEARPGEKWYQRYDNHTFSLFDPLGIPVVPANPPLITTLQRVGKKGLMLRSGEKLTIPAPLFAQEQKLQIAFTSVAFEQGPHLQFRYQLSGVDTGWVAASSDRRAYYAALPAGDYRFQVMVANREGDWQPTPTMLSFTILPPFYTQTWFQALGLLLGLGMFYFGIRAWEGNQKKRHLSRRRIAEDLHGQVGLALNSILQLSSVHQPSIKDRGPEFLERIEQQTLLASEKLSDLVWLINPENDAFDQFVHRVRDVAHIQLAPLGIIPTLLIEKEAGQAALPIEKRKELYLNFKATLAELISQQGFSRLQIRIAREKRQLKIELELQSPHLSVPSTAEPVSVRQVTLISAP